MVSAHDDNLSNFFFNFTQIFDDNIIKFKDRVMPFLNLTSTDCITELFKTG